MSFDPDRFYRPDELGEIAPKTTLAQWRYYGRGPRYHKFGALVAYSGKKLNEWIAEQEVVPTDSRGNEKKNSR